MGIVQLSGGLDHTQTQTVYYNYTNLEIGTVTPVSKCTHTTWEARDKQGNLHGDMWLSPWYAADALICVYESIKRKQEHQ